MQFTKSNLEDEGNLTYACFNPNGYSSTYLEFTARMYKGNFRYGVYVDGDLKHTYTTFKGLKWKYLQLITPAFKYQGL